MDKPRSGPRAARRTAVGGSKSGPVIGGPDMGEGGGPRRTRAVGWLLLTIAVVAPLFFYRYVGMLQSQSGDRTAEILASSPASVDRTADLQSGDRTASPTSVDRTAVLHVCPENLKYAPLIAWLLNAYFDKTRVRLMNGTWSPLAGVPVRHQFIQSSFNMQDRPRCLKALSGSPPVRKSPDGPYIIGRDAGEVGRGQANKTFRTYGDEAGCGSCKMACHKLDFLVDRSHGPSLIAVSGRAPVPLPVTSARPKIGCHGLWFLQGAAYEHTLTDIQVNTSDAGGLRGDVRWRSTLSGRYDLTRLRTPLSMARAKAILRNKTSLCLLASQRTSNFGYYNFLQSTC